MISIACSCTGEFWIRDRLAGREAVCPACGTTLAVPPLEGIKREMTPATCSCGEVFWSSSWQVGKVSRCPICGDAVGPSRSKSGITTIQAPETGRPAGPMPETLSTWANEGPSPPDGEPEAARRSAAVAPPTRPPLSTRGIGARASALAAGVLVLMVVGLIGVLRPPGSLGKGEIPAAPIPIDPPSPPLLRILVPAYFYPGGPGLKDWNRLIEAAPRVPIVAIVNPASGPGTEAIPDYTAVVSRAKAAGVQVIGYVNTEHGKRPRPEIEADIDRWVRFYPAIQGIFFDAQASGVEHVDLYAALHASVRRKIKEAVLISNPGTICAEEYFARSVVDVAIVFEHHKDFETFELPTWAKYYPDRRFAAIPYSVKTASQMKYDAQLAVLKGFRYLYVTDGVLPNPWIRLPHYWDAEVEVVKQVNERKSF